MSYRKKPTIRPAVARDFPVWNKMWKQYCDFYKANVPARVTRATWKRIISSKDEIYCLLALDDKGRAVGFANYVLHPYTWGTGPSCYLEDLFVDAAARGQGVGHALIKELLKLADKKKWDRVYWHTNEDNYAARRLYDRFLPRDNYVRYRIFV